MTTNRHPVSQAPLPERTRPFWLEVRWYIETIWALFQGPEAIAACYAMARQEYTMLAAWLRQAEAFARRVLLADALDLKIDAPKGLRTFLCAKKIRSPADATEDFDPDAPQTWRAPFRLRDTRLRDTYLFAGEKDTCPYPDRKKYKEVRFPDCRNLARRFEALCRVWDAPELYVKRLARLIRKTPKAIAPFLQPVAFETSMDAMFEALRQLNEARAAAKRVLNTS